VERYIHNILDWLMIIRLSLDLLNKMPLWRDIEKQFWCSLFRFHLDRSVIYQMRQG